MRVSFTLGLLAAVAIHSTASAREPVTLAPAKPWNLHYSDNSCQLFRQFGDAAKPTTLILESLAPDTGMAMMIVGGALTSKPGMETATATFVPGTGRTFDGGKISETAKDQQTAIYWSSISLLPDDPAEAAKEKDRARYHARKLANREIEQAAAATITGLQVTEPRKRVTVLKTGSLAKVMAMVRECNREQMTEWGLDPAVQDRIVLGAKSSRNLASLFNSSDYPLLALAKGEMATVAARLIVNAEGKVSKCTSLTPFTGEGFKEVVCERLSTATFEPAELADGTKVPTFVITRIIFQFPDS